MYFVHFEIKVENLKSDMASYNNNSEAKTRPQPLEAAFASEGSCFSVGFAPRHDTYLAHFACLLALRQRAWSITWKM